MARWSGAAVRAMFRSLHRKLVGSSTVGASNSRPSGCARSARPRPGVDPQDAAGVDVRRGGGSVSLAWSVPSRAARIGLVASMLGLVSLVGAVPVGAAQAITLTTPYPGVAVAPGATVNFDISITTDAPGRVALAVAGTPTDWTATLRGGGFTVDGVETDGTSTPTKVTLGVTVPQGATEGTQRIVLRGVTTGGSRASDTLPVDVRVTPNAAGDVTL